MKATLASLLALSLSMSVFAAEETVKAFTGSYQDALKKAGESGKPVMIDFYTDW